MARQIKSVAAGTHARVLCAQNHASHAILRLQRTIGNRAVRRLSLSITRGPSDGSISAQSTRSARASNISRISYYSTALREKTGRAGCRPVAHALTPVPQNHNFISRYHAVYRRARLEPDQSTSEVHTRSAIQSHGRYTIINRFLSLGPDVFRFRFRFNFIPDPDSMHVRIRQRIPTLPWGGHPSQPQRISTSFSGQDLIFVLSIPVGSEWSIQMDDPPPFEWRRKIISWGCRRCW